MGNADGRSPSAAPYTTPRQPRAAMNSMPPGCDVPSSAGVAMRTLTPAKTERLASAKSSEVIDCLAPVLQGSDSSRTERS
jgi:hypothetical protein